MNADYFKIPVYMKITRKLEKIVGKYGVHGDESKITSLNL